MLAQLLVSLVRIREAHAQHVLRRIVHRPTPRALHLAQINERQPCNVYCSHLCSLFSKARQNDGGTASLAVARESPRDAGRYG